MIVFSKSIMVTRMYFPYLFPIRTIFCYSLHIVPFFVKTSIDTVGSITFFWKFDRILRILLLNNLYFTYYASGLPFMS